MEIATLENNLKAGKLNSIYLLYGEERYLLDNCLKKIGKLFGEKINGINYIQIDNNNVSEIIQDIETPAFGYSKKLIVAKDTGLFQKSAKRKKKAESSETATKKEENTSVTTTTSLYDKYESMNILEVNFDNLKSINPDTVGWIKVPGTKINYPFVHTKDNEYYLKHTFDN